MTATPSTADDAVTIATAAFTTGINMTSVTNAAVSGSLAYTRASDGRMLVSLADVKALAAGAGIRVR